MEFEETFDKKINKDDLLEAMIYFLVKNNEVVYVGQTYKGISRLYAHEDKDYDCAYMKYCSLFDLDELENYYIMKYKPKYNKMCNNAMRYGLQNAKKKIQKELKLKNFDIRQLKKILKELNIEPIIMFNVPTISVYQYNDTLKHLKEINYGKRF